MHAETISELTDTFEGHAQQTEQGVEYWLARDLQHLLGYAKWQNFTRVIDDAKIACDVSGHEVLDHFADVGKMVQIGSGTKRRIQDMMLTRFACYLIAQNGDPQKSEIAFAQTYFALQTRKAELIQQRFQESERVSARHDLKATEKELSKVIFEQTGSDRHFGLIRSKGDTALFGRSTKQMKATWNVPDKQPLADFAPTIILTAKKLAAEITIHNTQENDFRTEPEISDEHTTNNATIRGALLDRGIRPERLPPAEDIKKVERRLKSSQKRSLKNPERLE
ncbi:DNA damage-inducible protein D [Spirulina major]|uniref:DNA damage-inducible protein D n=1 Tax=Spirulina major TaxID=270636 RepID=UPI000932A30C|nr:DNA damage-inducible protein D [Spirulina major]